MPAGLTPNQTHTILALAANPADTMRLRLDKEVREINHGLQRGREGFVLQPQWAVRPADIRRAMLDYRPVILHFCGHGEGEAGLVFENEQGQSVLVDADALADLVRLFSAHIQCIVLNACYSEAQATALARHIPYVVGMNQTVSDEAAVEFAVAFYDALGAGESYEFAYQLGCNAIRMRGLPESPCLKTRQQAPIATAPLTASFSGLSVFLAEVSDDLQPQRQQLKAHLQQFDIRVLPEDLYYFPDATRLHQAVERDLSRAALFVQLLSSANPVRPPGMSTPLLQYQRAKAVGLPILQWRAVDAEAADIADAGYRQLLETPGMVIAPLEEFKHHLTRRLQHTIAEKQAARRPESSANILVFVNAAPEDNADAERIGLILDAHGIGYCLPLSGDLPPAERRQDLEANLLDCDAVIVLYDQGPLLWVREQLRYCRRLAGRRDKPFKIIAVCNRIGADKPALGMNLPNLRILDFTPVDDSLCLPAFLQALNA